MKPKISKPKLFGFDRLSKQLNVMQTTHLQQPDHSLKFKRAERQTQHVGVRLKSNAECEVYIMVLF